MLDTMPVGKTAVELSDRLAEQGIKVSQFGDYKIRLVTHHGVVREDINHTVAALAHIMRG